MLATLRFYTRVNHPLSRFLHILFLLKIYSVMVSNERPLVYAQTVMGDHPLRPTLHKIQL